MTDKVDDAEQAHVVKLTRWLKNDIRPMERCCGHHLLAHDAAGCLITGCGCRNDQRAMAGEIRLTVAAK